MRESSNISNDLSALTVAILVGGLGTRLRSIVPDRPKVLAPVRQKPFLAYLLDQLANCGASHVVLCCGYLGGQVRESFGETYRHLQLVYSQEETPLGTAGALRKAVPEFQSDLILVMNGDSYCQADLLSFYHWHDQNSARASLLLVKVSDTSSYGRVELGIENRVGYFEEKNVSSAAGWINAGIYLIQKELLLSVSSDRAVSLEKDMLPIWAEQGFLYGFKSEALFIDIGTPGSYQLAEGLLPE